MKLKKKLLGHVGVDSGHLLVCDPAYIDSEWIKEELEFNDDARGSIAPAKSNFSYAATVQDKHQLNYKLGHAGVGITFSSGYGDGVYPVYGYFNKEDRCMKVEIDMQLTTPQKKLFDITNK